MRRMLVALMTTMLLALSFASPAGAAPRAHQAHHTYVRHAASVACAPNCAVNFSWTAAQDGTAASAGKERQTCLTQSCPSLDGNVVIMSWAGAEPQPGVFNWKPFDDEIARWSAQGYASALDIQYINDQGTSSCPSTTDASWQSMPGWAYAGVPTVCGTSSHGTYLYPDYCSPTFMVALDSFIAAVGQHYASTNLAYVRIGTGIGAEAAEARDGTGSSAWSQLTAWNCTGTNWVNWVEQRESTWQHSFTNLVSGYNATWFSTNGVPGQEQYAIADAANGIGLSPTNLTPGFTYANVTSTMHQINTNDPNLMRGYQTDPNVNSGDIAAYTQTAYCYAGGSRNHAGMFVEWYANVPPMTGVQSAMNTLFNYANGLASPSGGDASYCAGQAGY